MAHTSEVPQLSTYVPKWVEEVLPWEKSFSMSKWYRAVSNFQHNLDERVNISFAQDDFAGVDQLFNIFARAHGGIYTPAKLVNYKGFQDRKSTVILEQHSTFIDCDTLKGFAELKISDHQTVAVPEKDEWMQARLTVRLMGDFQDRQSMFYEVARLIKSAQEVKFPEGASYMSINFTERPPHLLRFNPW